MPKKMIGSQVRSVVSKSTSRPIGTGQECLKRALRNGGGEVGGGRGHAGRVHRKTTTWILLPRSASPTYVPDVAPGMSTRGPVRPVGPTSQRRHWNASRHDEEKNEGP